MNISLLAYILIGVILLGSIISYIVFTIKNRKNKKTVWQDANYLTISEFNDLNGDNILNTSKIRKVENRDYEYTADIDCGFLIASGEANKGSLPKNHFKASEYNVEKDINMYITRADQNPHFLVFGGTGSGKTDTVLIPNILANALSKQRPSGLVFDPKGEIYEKVAPFLRAQGYRVININLASSTKSHSWSPFQFAIDCGLEHVKYALINSWLVGNDQNRQEIEALQTMRKSEAKTSINETSDLLIKLSDSESSVWTNTAIEILSISANALFELQIKKAFKKALQLEKYQDYVINSSNYEERVKEVLSDVELDTLIKEELKYLSVKNVANLVSTTTQESWVSFVWSQGWFDKIGSFNATADQFRSFQMNIASGLAFLGGEDFEDFISQSSFNYQDLIDQHTIIFINIPASAEKRKAIATLMVQQIWAFLELKSKLYEGGKLPVPFFFYFEELANIPKIPCFMSILTLGRGMGIFAFVVVQSLKQFNAIYGNDKIDEVWGNTATKIYLLQQDAAGREYISKQYGDIEVEKEDGSKVIRPLVDPAKLGRIQKGECVVMMQRESPIWLNTASYNNYLFFHEWERKKLLNIEPQRNWKDKGNKKLKKKTSKEIVKIKEQLNTIFTEKNQIDVLPNIIEAYNSSNEVEFAKILLISLVNAILNLEHSKKLKELLITGCLNAIEENKKKAEKKAAVDTNAADTTTDTIDTNGEDIEDNDPQEVEIVYSDEYCAYKSLCEQLCFYLEGIVSVSDHTETKEVGVINDMIIDLLTQYKQESATFPYSEVRNDPRKLPHFIKLVKTLHKLLYDKNELITIPFYTYLSKINFYDLHINRSKEASKRSAAASQKEAEQEVHKIEQSVSEKVIDNDYSDTVKKVREEKMVEVMSDDDKKLIINSKFDEYKNNQFIGTDKELFIANKLQIFERIIIMILLLKSKAEWPVKSDDGKQLSFEDYWKKISNNQNIPDGISEELLDTISISPDLLDLYKKLNIVRDTQLREFKKINGLKYNDLIHRYNHEKIDGKEPDKYFAEVLIHWLKTL